MKNVLITGANGQLGRELQLHFSGYDNYNIFPTDVAELDIADKSAVARFVVCNHIDFIINCAAYTAVDAAEENADLCQKLNVDAVANLAEIAAECGAKLLHISTDYVFDGNACKPYNEDDTVNPLSVYGKTKFDGEMAVRQLAPTSIIIRTAWLYSPHGKNFVKTMLSLGATRSELNVVF
ncbi:MAG: SDR family oxidoreductase, partial [Muribaculaceae bacterium]